MSETTMRLNTIKPAEGATHYSKRVGRGIGSGLGKTCGRGHKGQKSRAGGFHKVGFEGGQMPLYRRLPKRGFKSLTRRFIAELRLDSFNFIEAEDFKDNADAVINLAFLQNIGLVKNNTLGVKIIASGECKTKATLTFDETQIKFSEKAKQAVIAAGGKFIQSEVKKFLPKKFNEQK